jgi:hypothetical protein
MRLPSPRLFDSESMQRCHLHQCRAACCLYGVWLDEKEAEYILAHATEIIPFMPAESKNPETWLDGRAEDDPHSESGHVVHSTVVTRASHYGGTACIFLRSDHKCALQVASATQGKHPWHFKPFYCVLHPLDLDKEGRITLDETPLLLEEEGSCLRTTKEKIPLLLTFEPELRYLLGTRNCWKIMG